ncbi:hypothetical protein CEXT_330801 [Caerostris extrusa]|uniref:Uncharacterized protein n=1 Tax=Caerostris extrusa TaxID=172846 RepID=A0AAV4N779_CAEEX|nr:hypothetical protein CEXT_330801 [Caerostris extrusa]
MYSDRDFSDVELKMDAESFFAHKGGSELQVPSLQARCSQRHEGDSKQLRRHQDLALKPSAADVAVRVHGHFGEILRGEVPKTCTRLLINTTSSLLSRNCTQLLQKQPASSNACEGFVFTQTCTRTQS